MTAVLERFGDARVTPESATRCEARQVYDVLVREYGFAGSYQAVRGYLRRRFGPAPVQAVRRVELPPGVQAQHDWFEDEVGIAGERVPGYGLIGTLSFSRATFVWVSPTMTQLAWQSGHLALFQRLWRESISSAAASTKARDPSERSLPQRSHPRRRRPRGLPRPAPEAESWTAASDVAPFDWSARAGVTAPSQPACDVIALARVDRRVQAQFRGVGQLCCGEETGRFVGGPIGKISVATRRRIGSQADPSVVRRLDR